MKLKNNIVNFLHKEGWNEFYSDNYWIPPGGSDYSGKTLCEAYITAKYPKLNAQDKFDKVMQLEYQFNQNRRLGIVGKTFDHKTSLQNKFQAVWSKKYKIWHVDPKWILEDKFHKYCYDRKRNFQFKWIK